jgi:orotidine-5'-phosphate decarboxylase
MTGRERLLVALDTPDEQAARRLVAQLRDGVGGFKVGLELFTVAGPRFVSELVDSGAFVFLDLKLHDIPHTVAGAAAAAARLGVRLLTVHALGGSEMIRRALESSDDAASAAGRRRPIVLAVTILTSHSAEDLVRLGIDGPAPEAVRRLADLARDAGAKGAVCSAHEVARVRASFPVGTLVVPGIRPGGAVPGEDQARVATPARAVELGADYLVVGRPITAASDPGAAAQAIVAQLDASLRA